MEWTEKVTDVVTNLRGKLGEGVQEVKGIPQKAGGASSAGPGNSIGRPKIGRDGSGTDEVNIDFSATARNKAAGKANRRAGS